eukprot:TRINITY_DN8057_c2_g1_i1.p1 TRINITY_DN8057_c2_g1~~TRINITY_DN8057_c2_g1_i1.p1  ORF type:complete len:401 (-),score=51.76 TRINITY_DN8057_c2_g1_i1:327-1529(-)
MIQVQPNSIGKGEDEDPLKRLSAKFEGAQKTGRKRGKSCSTWGRRCWTSIYVATWILWFTGAMYGHASYSTLDKPLKNFPKALMEGFKVVLGFDAMVGEAKNIKTACGEAVAKCGRTIPTCSINFNPQTCLLTPNIQMCQNVSTMVEFKKIKLAFNRSLTNVLKVTSDKYFGTPSLAAASSQLTAITNQTDKLKPLATTAPCFVVLPLYCNIHTKSAELEKGAAKVSAQIDKFQNNKFVKDFENYSGKLGLLHALPYVLCLSLFFFFVFWWRDAACCLFGGGFIGCTSYILHFILWLVFFILSTIICAIGYTYKYFADRIPTGKTFNQDPTMKDLLVHLEKTFPRFWDLVFQPLSDPCEQFLLSVSFFELVCVLILFYGWITCCCCPYTEKQYQFTGDME